MHDDTDNKKHASGTTSPSKPRPSRASEAEYLKREADDARDAASHTLGQMRQSLKDAGDVRAWARTYPWTTLGAAAAVGFFAAAVVVPRRRRPQDEENAALLERILTDEQIESRLRELAAEDVGKPSREHVLHTLVASLVKTFGPAVQSAVGAALAAHPPQTDSTGGAPPDEPTEVESSGAPDVGQPPPLPD
jgi:ElaB/YqjD/DUF883 family membrane-anchored ribosome-binding protein